MARMIASENIRQGKVNVRYICTHTNHELGLGECRNLPLPQSVRQEIQQQFAAGITLERIVDSKSHYSLVMTH